jgi:hypothetical protein
MTKLTAADDRPAQQTLPHHYWRRLSGWSHHDRITYVRVKRQGHFRLTVSRVTEIGEQAVAAVAASLARGGPVIKGQLIASRFYEAMQRELKQLPMHDPKRAALRAASARCERIAAARISPTALLDELRRALALLTDDHPREPPPRGRPVLQLIEGGLSKI